MLVARRKTGRNGVWVLHVRERLRALRLGHGAPVRLAAGARPEKDVEVQHRRGLAHLRQRRRAREHLDELFRSRAEIEASVTFLPATRTMEYPSPSSSTRLGDQRAAMSAPVPARSTSGIALETTRPSEPSATVNLRGVGATKPSGAEMETDAGSSIARQVVIRRGRGGAPEETHRERAGGGEGSGHGRRCGGRCAGPRRSADTVETRRRFLVAESPPRKRPQAAVFASPAPVPGTRRAGAERPLGTALYRARTTPPHSSPKRTCASRPRRPIALFPPLGGCVRRGRLAEGRPARLCASAGASSQESFTQPVFPFSQVVNHEAAKVALVLAAVDPRVGGVALLGGHGTCKSTLARARARSSRA